MAKPRGGLTKWFGKGKGGNWVDISAPKKNGKFQPCGRKSATKSKRGYPKCVPAATARTNAYGLLAHNLSILSPVCLSV
jgi:hypothetical protein